MSPKASKLFSRLLDINWDLSKGNFNSDDRKKLKAEYRQLENALIEEMGYEEFENFVNAGKKMFS